MLMTIIADGPLYAFPSCLSIFSEELDMTRALQHLDFFETEIGCFFYLSAPRLIRLWLLTLTVVVVISFL